MTRNDRMNLDVDAPDKVAAVLREAAEAYFEAANELTAAWQDANAGKPWLIIGGILETAANQIDRKI